MNKQPETTLAAIIHTSGFLESVKIAGLEDMQLAVDGKIGLAPMDFMRLAEPLSPHEGKFHVYVNTDGANRRLPLNLPVALAMGMLVHGDVLVTGWPDEDDGAVTALPPARYGTSYPACYESPNRQRYTSSHSRRRISHAVPQKYEHRGPDGVQPQRGGYAPGRVRVMPPRRVRR